MEDFKPSSTPRDYGQQDCPYFMAVGKHDERKNYPRLLRAFTRFCRDNPSFEVKLIIVGPQGEASHEIEYFSTNSSVIVTDFVSTKELASLYSHAIALIQPSLQEGFGLPIIEAMASGCPVICSNTSSMPEIVQDAGLYMDPLCEESIYEALLAIYRDSALRKSLREKGLKRAAEFSWEKAADEMHAIYLRYC